MSEAHNPNEAPQDLANQPVNLRRRKDIEVAESAFQGEKCWILKDPVSLKYYRIREPEFLVFNKLDGASTLAQIQGELSRLLGGIEIPIDQVKNLVGSLHQRELLVSRRPDQASRLLDKVAKTTRLKRFARFTNLLSIRFPGVDPERFLAWLYPKTKWLFHPVVVVASLILMVAAGMLVLINANEVSARLPEMHQFFGFKNLVLMGLLLIITKSLHEIGHGLACKHFGGECHEIGFMLLVLMPVMYCNTSDSWVLKNKWHRMAIGAAGMYVEVVLASICTFIWWYTNPSALNYICLNIMFISSVTTVIFNANPLLRYDGYYILSDYLEIPNMGQKSRAALLSKMRTLCLGFPPLPERMLPQRRQFAFALYSVASFCYRWFVLFFILWFLSELFEPYGLQIIGHFMIGLSLIGLVILPLYRLSKFFASEKVRSQVNKTRLAASAVVVALLLIGLWFVPVPHYVNAPFVIRPSDAKTIYVKNPGILKQVLVQPGDEVKLDQPIAILEDLETKTRLNSVLGENESLNKEIQLLSQIESNDPNQIQQLSARFASLQSNENRLDTEQRIFDSLVLKASAAGIVLPPTQMRPENPDPQQLQEWIGSPMQPENLNSYLQRNVEFCRIASSNKFEAVLEIDQTSIDLVEVDCPVKLVFDEYQLRRFTSHVQDIAISETVDVSGGMAMNAGGNVATRVDANGQQATLFTSYQAIVPVEQDKVHLLSGFRGQARIKVGNTPLGRQLWRYVRTVFNFK